ncbi:MAG: Co2+/Mg2+ efflux protein ApaG [Deltaproteobacteria bacterium]|nr:MAG: Co2+/Mg2+ efflux protein ApaG [Deltaproteobacteria bacterium]
MSTPPDHGSSPARSDHAGNEHGSVAVTRDIRVQVRPRYLPERSAPDRGLWVHAYEVTIRNDSDVAIQLMSRHWIITDARGVQEHVRGPGVVGQQPIIRPGETYTYTSGCPLRTALGSMHGSYQVVDAEGEHFDVEIAPFTLAEPYALN